MRGAAALVLAAALAGCAGGRDAAEAIRVYDFGIDAPAAKITALRLGAVRAAAPFDGQDVLYRLAYRDAGELAAYTRTRWAAAPAELLRTQVARALEPGAARCSLELELQEISQVFSAPATSEARLEVAATLRGAAGPVAARAIRLAEPGAGKDAAEGMAAMRRAVGRVLGELAAWVGSVAECR